MDKATRKAVPIQRTETSDDQNPQETVEWIESLVSLLETEGPDRARFVLDRLESEASNMGLAKGLPPFSAYRNSIPLERQPPYPGDVEVEQKITAINRWNALAMVVKANRAFGGLGGHIASYASAAEIFEVGFNHFFRGADAKQGADLVYFQPHSAPGVYARAFLEGRLKIEDLEHYRQETGGVGLSSYPHPWLMPDFWQFPTGSMGIGPINAIYQARFMRYLEARSIASTVDRHVWGVFGDGEMDEPEAIAGLTLAAREELDNLTFIVNCNLQRLDGPVRGNGQIVQELDALFTGAGWNVIKVLWGSEWDELFARDKQHVLLSTFAATVDGQFQNLGSKDGAYNMLHFFQQSDELQSLVAHMSSDEVDALKRGGHDFRKLHAAFSAARNTKGRPTVILAKTKKGFGMGQAGESRMKAHQAKVLDLDALKSFRNQFRLPLSDEDLEQLNFVKPSLDSSELTYLKTRRQELGGALPARRMKGPQLEMPDLELYGKFATCADGKQMSTTMAAVRLIHGLIKHKGIGRRVVPIVADEARTFGMESLFRQVGIYAPQGQLYEPEDADSILCYKESESGQILEEGITEAGAISSWVAAATSYSVHGQPMVPFYIFYSMFGFQRVGDLIWAAADQRSRGFLLGATAGRTTLSGEGLQHQDGTSLLSASTVPNCRVYDPAWAYELAVIMNDGLQRMYVEQEDVFYYITVANENYDNPSLPTGVEAGILKGLYQVQSAEGDEAEVRLLGSGPILRESLEASRRLKEDWGVDSEVWSATSFAELARDAADVERWNRLNPQESPRISHLASCLTGAAPVIAATDYVRAWPQTVAGYLPARYLVLGTDGFGRSDTRVAMRRFFEVDKAHITLAALQSLVEQGKKSPEVLIQCMKKYGIEGYSAAPWTL